MRARAYGARCGPIVAILLMAALSLPALAGPRGCLGWGRTTNPAPHPWPGGVESHWAQMAKLPDETDILLLGDSHATLWPADLWQPLRAINAGQPGDWIENVLWRLGAPEWQKLKPQN